MERGRWEMRTKTMKEREELTMQNAVFVVSQLYRKYVSARVRSCTEMGHPNRNGD